MELDELKTIFENYTLPINELANSLDEAAAKLKEEKVKGSLILFLYGMRANYELLIKIGRLTDDHYKISLQHRADILERLESESN